MCLKNEQLKITMPLQKTNLGAPTKRCLKIRSKFTEHPRQSVTLTKLHNNSIEITLRLGSYLANSPLTSRKLSHKKFHGGLLLKKESYL